MSKIYVCEVPGLAATQANEGAVAIVPTPSTIEYSVIVSAASSGPPQPFAPTTAFIEVSADTTCSIAVGLFPGVIGAGSAALTNRRLNANERITLRVPFSPQYGGASTIPQNPPLYGIFTTANV
jgi:hypothetical protein